MCSKDAAVLLVGPGLAMLPGLERELRTRGFEIEIANSGEAGLSRAAARNFAVIASELEMPGVSGLDLLARLRLLKPPPPPLILVTSHATADSAIEASKLGVYELVSNPIDILGVADLISKAAVSKAPLTIPLTRNGADPVTLVGSSPAMQTLYKEIGLAARSPWSVLIRGATGTGKEPVAHAIHSHSDRKGKPLVIVNCAAIPETLFESELFGHEAGAFTGAQGKQLGLFEQADKGTVLLDEVGDLTLPMQVKLLRVLQEKQIQRLGGTKIIDIDVRVLAATNRDLDHAIEREQFREDLFYRLTPFTIWVPSLRRRLEDIPDLAWQIIGHSLAGVQAGTPLIDADAIRFLQNQPWPGNVRQLENVIHQALSLSRFESIGLGDVMTAYLTSQRPDQLAHRTFSGYIDELLDRAERGLISDVHNQMSDETERLLLAKAIRRAHGNLSKVARWFGTGRKTIREKLLRYKLDNTGEDVNDNAIPQPLPPPASPRTLNRQDI